MREIQPCREKEVKSPQVQ